MGNESFDNVKDQVGFCGIWCDSCSGGNGSIIELTKLYEEQVKNNHLELCAPKDFDLKEFMMGLSSIQKMSQCPGCHKGGGNPNCKIRLCAKERGVEDCSKCSQLQSCENFLELESELPDVRANLLKLRNTRHEEQIESWKNDLKSKWPHCILFCNSLK